MGPWRRERILARADGSLIVQVDPFSFPKEEIIVDIGKEVVRFVYDISVIEEDEHGREIVMAWYREIEEE